MMNLITFPNENVVGLNIHGKVSTEELEQVTDAIESKLEQHEKLRLYVEMEDFEGMSFEAFFKDLKFGVKNWDRFDKEAIVTDKDWMEKIAGAADKVFRNIEVRTFEPENKDQAKEWVLN